MFLQGAESVQVLTELPALNLFKRKAVLVVKARRGIAIEKDNFNDELVFMEFSRHVIEHMSIIAEVGRSSPPPHHHPGLPSYGGFPFESGRYPRLANGVDGYTPTPFNINCPSSVTHPALGSLHASAQQPP